MPCIHLILTLAIVWFPANASLRPPIGWLVLIANKATETKFSFLTMKCHQVFKNLGLFMIQILIMELNSNLFIFVSGDAYVAAKAEQEQLIRGLSFNDKHRSRNKKQKMNNHLGISWLQAHAGTLSSFNAHSTGSISSLPKHILETNN